MALWRVGPKPVAVERSGMPTEKQLEEMLVADLRILSENWLLIGNQVQAGSGFIDILAIARDGALVVIELKRAETSRNVVSQLLDYVSWASAQEPERVMELFQEKNGVALDQKFSEKFGASIDFDQINARQLGVIVASSPDSTTERIIKYLAANGVPVNVNTFDVFKDNDRLYLHPNWTVDLVESQGDVTERTLKSPWNGHYYGSFGHEPGGRKWDDARKFGFLSAGGGAWYSQTLKLLHPDDLVWVQVPAHGYVGVGRVTSSVQPIEDFVVEVDGDEKQLLDLELQGTYANRETNNPEVGEFAVGIKWLHTVPLEQATKQLGFFGNQNSVCKPRVSRWSHTVSTLKSLWKVDVD